MQFLSAVLAAAALVPAVSAWSLDVYKGSSSVYHHQDTNNRDYDCHQIYAPRDKGYSWYYNDNDGSGKWGCCYAVYNDRSCHKQVDSSCGDDRGHSNQWDVYSYKVYNCRRH